MAFRLSVCLVSVKSLAWHAPTPPPSPFRRPPIVNLKQLYHAIFLGDRVNQKFNKDNNSNRVVSNYTR